MIVRNLSIVLHSATWGERSTQATSSEHTKSRNGSALNDLKSSTNGGDVTPISRNR